ncbi:MULTISPECIES: PAQR family membrane homeostasis protein TrhA [unclassified Brevundimonas]|uniref:PAQR family membrane homeostasis protein TrhA n=1 Tax=unclassified Brevundimonas TaxID=2622653 RepID=UPI0025C33A18|nr:MULTISPECIES: hemolysin III family protein [unclassified Brevundimonas]
MTDTTGKPAPFKRLLRLMTTPDAMDMEEHYATRAEKLADLWVHLVGLIAALVGAGVLATLAGIYSGIGALAATLLYSLCLIGMLTASTIYNQTHPCAARPVLRRLDEAFIFLMIAGSYTPITTQRFEGDLSIWFTALVWTIGLGGAFAKMFVPRLSDVFWSGVYVLFGWLIVFAIKPMIASVSPVALGLLVAGGVTYTVGVLFFINRALKFRRAIWHSFVVAGAGMHWAAILIGVVLAPSLG